MAMVHDAIYKAKDLESVEAESYLKNLVNLIAQSYGRKIATEIHANVSLPLDRMLKIGMIVNELYTNSLKHAVETEKSPFVLISLHRFNGQCKLRYSQTGFMHVDPDRLIGSKGLGMTLVKLSIEEMEGRYEVASEESTLLLTFTFDC